MKIPVLLCICLLGIQFQLIAQPSNDVCATAILVSAGSITMDFSDATYSGICDIDCMLSISGENFCAKDLWYRFDLQDSMVSIFTYNTVFGAIYYELFEGTCSNLTQLGCGSLLQISPNLGPGAYFIKFSVTSSQNSGFADVAFCRRPYLDPLCDVYACESYTLPPIDGINLSGKQAYYLNASGQGQALYPGESITQTTTLYAFDGDNLRCQDAEQFVVDISFGGITRKPIISGSWFLTGIWGGFSEPDACDDVIIESPIFLDLGSSSNVANCKTLEVELGAQFEVELGRELQVGMK